MKVADRVIILGRALQKNYDRRGYSSDTVFDVVEGRKYWKIMMINNQESVHAFIDKKTGDVFKPASWRGPAKIARYNLLNEVSYRECINREDSEGKKFGDELERVGWVGDEEVGNRKMKAFYELHIEQGPILEAEGKDIGSILSIDDISEQERLEAIRRDFVSNISHELKTPIGAIALLAETIEDEPDPKIVKSFLPKIIKETDRLTDTIDDLLTLSRIEHGSLEHFSEIDLLRPIMQAQDRVRTFAAQKNVEVNVILPEDSKTIFGDAIQLTSAFYNLLENSVKYSKPGGGNTTIKVENIGDIVQLSFSDNGIGIPTKDQDRIFERFYCVDRSHSGSGVGLGLAIVRHVVVNHEGLISVQSHEGVGTTFTIQLPNSNKDITKENLAPDKNQPIEPQVSNEV